MTDRGDGNNTAAGDLTGQPGTDRVGERVADRFVVKAKIAEGAHGVVWSAVQEPLGRTVALKVLRRDAVDPHAEERLLREGRVLSALRQENLVAIYDVGRTAAGDLFLAMEYVDGAALRATINAGPLPWPDVVALGLGISRALAAAHKAHVVHRDLKPENVLRATRETHGPAGAAEIRVVDFGLARSDDARAHGAALSSSDVLRGTPAYMSPEQASGGPGDARSDLYALGVVLYELLTGANPFVAENALKTLLRHSEGPRPAAPSTYVACPSALDALVLGLLSRDPAARPKDADSVAAQLAAQLPAQRAATLRTPAPAQPSTVAARAPRFAGALAAAAAVLLVVAIAAGSRPQRPAPLTVAPAAAPVVAVDPGAPAPAPAARQPAVGEAPHAGLAMAAQPAHATPRAAPRSSPLAPDAGVAVPQSPAAAALLPTKIEHLRAHCTARVPCAERLVAGYARAVGGDLSELKAVRDAVDGCVAACALAAP